MELIVESGHHGVLRRTDVQKARAFATVVLEVDSVISSIDGLTWLAARRGDVIAHRVAALTAQMRAGDPHAYAECLSAIRPRRDEVEQLREDFDGFWISDPAGVIHLVVGDEE